jgi:hypothetical protein
LLGVINGIRFINGMKKRKKNINSGRKEYQVELLTHTFTNKKAIKERRLNIM